MTSNGTSRRNRAGDARRGRRGQRDDRRTSPSSAAATSGWSWRPAWPSSAITSSGVDRSEALVDRAVQRRSCPIQEPGLPELVDRGPELGPPALHDAYELRHPRGRVHLPRRRHAADAGRRRGPAQHPRRDAVDRRARSTARRRSSSTRAPRRSAPARRSRASSGGARATGSVAPRIVSNPEFLRQGRAVRGLLPPRPDRRRWHAIEDAPGGRRPVRGPRRRASSSPTCAPPR